jgi:N-acetylmuramoyl-L-alanine amidase
VMPAQAAEGPRAPLDTHREIQDTPTNRHSPIQIAQTKPAIVVKPAVFDQLPRTKPVIMIDPGHGGMDPGAVGRGKTTEKTVVLAVAKVLKATLEKGGKYDVRLTRSSDVFVPLPRRVEMSVEAQADLFISLHADAIDDKSLANAIRGASIYTLSEKASDEQARLMAEKENAADHVAGSDYAAGERNDALNGILFDLLARETASFSKVFSRTLVGSLSKASFLAREPERAASFVVLKQTHAPCVLVELGFLSNVAEEQRMNQLAWQQQMSQAIATAVTTYFEHKLSSATLGTVATGGLPP